MHSHGEENLKNYLIPRAMLSSRVDGYLHKWIDAGNRGKTDELIRKKMSRRNHCSSILPRKKKFFATSESTRKAAGNNNIKTVHDVPFMPGNLSLSALTMLLQFMPEIDYQLLHNYADQIQNWGWICNFHSQASRSFTRKDFQGFKPFKCHLCALSLRSIFEGWLHPFSGKMRQSNCHGCRPQWQNEDALPGCPAKPMFKNLFSEMGSIKRKCEAIWNSVRSGFSCIDDF